MISSRTHWSPIAAIIASCLLRWSPLLYAADQAPAAKAESLCARLEIHLLKADGKPLGQQFRVHLFSAQGPVERNDRAAQSDTSGVVSFLKVPVGQYDLWLESATKSKVPGANVISAVPASVLHDLAVTQSATTQVLSLKVSAADAVAGMVQGHLQLTDGKTPAQGYTIAIQSGTQPLPTTPRAMTTLSYAQGARDCYAETRVAPDGSFSLSGLLPGTQQLDIRRPGERAPWFTIPVVPVRAGEAMSIGTWAVPKNGWQMMFDGQSLGKWKPTAFEGHSEVRIENGQLMLPVGHDMTGVTYTGELPHLDYEVSLEAMRVEGHDFFCGLTFPVEKEPCSLILGGWGGSVVGLSNVDGFDASENVTTRTMEFDNNHWYRVRLRVTKAKIEAWVDSEKIVDLDRTDKKFSIRMEVEESQPFGIATWRTGGALRDIRIRRLDSPTAP